MNCVLELVMLSPTLFYWSALTFCKGGQCGSTYIDRNFHALLSKRFGVAFDNVPTNQKGRGSMFMNCFEKLQRSFGVDEDAGEQDVYPLTMKIEDSEYYDDDQRAVKISQ